MRLNLWTGPESNVPRPSCAPPVFGAVYRRRAVFRQPWWSCTWNDKWRWRGQKEKGEIQTVKSKPSGDADATLDRYKGRRWAS